MSHALLDIRLATHMVLQSVLVATNKENLFSFRTLLRPIGFVNRLRHVSVFLFFFLSFFLACFLTCLRLFTNTQIQI